MLLQWSQDLVVGHPIIDYDHQMLVNIANELHHAVKFDQGDDEVALALGRWVQYLQTHFRREEALFMGTDYPHKDKHVQNHRDIEKLVGDFHAGFQKDPGAVDIEKLLEFLKIWLIKHIGKMDKSYAPYVKAMERQHGQYNRTGFA